MPASPTPLRLLAISGSLRAKSINTAVLVALQTVASTRGINVLLYDGLDALPHFNPDLDVEPAPASVTKLRDAVREADALVFCTPEYAHGVPGSLKNLLDWLVSFEGLIEKRVAVINARPEATVAIASLFETLAVMNTRLVNDACVTLPLTRNSLDAAALLESAEITALLHTALHAIEHSVRAR